MKQLPLLAFLSVHFLLLSACGTPNVLNGLYLGWLIYHNAGDDLLFHVAQRIFAERSVAVSGGTAVTALTFHYPPTNCEHMRISMGAYDFLVLGGGTILMSPEYTCALKSAVHHGVPIFVFGSGWASPRETTEIRATVEANNQSRIDSVLGLVSAFGHGGLRGPITKQAVVESVADHESVDTVADVLRRLPVLGDAGLLFPRHSQAKGADIANAVGSWSCFDGHESCSNRPIVAINYGHNFAGEYILHEDPKTVAMAFVDLISALTLDGRFDVIVYVIQGTDLQRLHEEIIVNVEPSPRVKFFLSVQDATSMFEILSQATYCVNYKLHASISCLAAGAYALEVPYSRKWDDWESFLGATLREYTVLADTSSNVSHEKLKKRGWPAPPVVVKTNELGARVQKPLGKAFSDLMSLFGTAAKGHESQFALTSAQRERRNDFARGREQLLSTVREAYVAAADKFLREQVALKVAEDDEKML